MNRKHRVYALYFGSIALCLMWLFAPTFIPTPFEPLYCPGGQLITPAFVGDYRCRYPDETTTDATPIVLRYVLGSLGIGVGLGLYLNYRWRFYWRWQATTARVLAQEDATKRKLGEFTIVTDDPPNGI
ncbi:MAG: hypothetical protein MUF87_20240 [Anaerolineae bacterium]|jgi:hypothetical protein|nr:hypothetical protein [Anaerolineae bacterium]